MLLVPVEGRINQQRNASSHRAEPVTGSVSVPKRPEPGFRKLRGGLVYIPDARKTQQVRGDMSILVGATQAMVTFGEVRVVRGSLVPRAPFSAESHVLAGTNCRKEGAQQRHRE